VRKKEKPMSETDEAHVKYQWVDDWERTMMFHRRVSLIAAQALRKTLDDVGGDLDAAARSLGVDPAVVREVATAFGIESKR
jgi:hypothetical protein